MFSAAAFVLLFIGCSVLAFMRNPMYGLGLYLATVYVHPPSRWWSYMLPDLRWTFIAGAIAVAARTRQAREARKGSSGPGTGRCRASRC